MHGSLHFLILIRRLQIDTHLESKCCPEKPLRGRSAMTRGRQVGAYALLLALSQLVSGNVLLKKDVVGDLDEQQLLQRTSLHAATVDGPQCSSPETGKSFFDLNKCVAACAGEACQCKEHTDGLVKTYVCTSVSPADREKCCLAYTKGQCVLYKKDGEGTAKLSAADNEIKTESSGGRSPSGDMCAYAATKEPTAGAMYSGLCPADTCYAFCGAYVGAQVSTQGQVAPMCVRSSPPAYKGNDQGKETGEAGGEAGGEEEGETTEAPSEWISIGKVSTSTQTEDEEGGNEPPQAPKPSAKQAETKHTQTGDDITAKDPEMAAAATQTEQQEQGKPIQQPAPKVTEGGELDRRAKSPKQEHLGDVHGRPPPRHRLYNATLHTSEGDLQQRSVHGRHHTEATGQFGVHDENQKGTRDEATQTDFSPTTRAPSVKLRCCYCQRNADQKPAAGTCLNEDSPSFAPRDCDYVCVKYHHANLFHLFDKPCEAVNLCRNVKIKQP
ncbi:unnamed protein product [Vitrella brassicaformis CCMP3155]|uniref:Uncharacterized protein n=2 Tax=Vitrella brassicaformis TaxID=1169539 RepID=A0A0G4ETJ7_VITBC|nr:unnamed protein product [Vitrella brassicaformis CCMP3155]|eukprot:CEM01636.1 unnamed protein product [Vitrella brassicaformis CCMP3155]